MCVEITVYSIIYNLILKSNRLKLNYCECYVAGTVIKDIYFEVKLNIFYQANIMNHE